MVIEGSELGECLDGTFGNENHLVFNSLLDVTTKRATFHFSEEGNTRIVWSMFMTVIVHLS